MLSLAPTLLLTAFATGPIAGPPPPAAVPRVAFLRAAAFTAKHEISVSQHGFQEGDEAVTGAFGVVSKVFAAGGASPVRHAFAIRRDEGLTEEIGVLREKTKQGGKLVLDIVAAPGTKFTQKPKLKLRVNGVNLGVNTPESSIVALGGVAYFLPSPAREQLAIVRRDALGRESLAIHELPAGKKGDLSGPLATVLAIDGGASALLTRALTVADVDAANEGSELLLLRTAPDGATHLEVRALPPEGAADSLPLLMTFAIATDAALAGEVAFASRIPSAHGSDAPFENADFLLVREPVAAKRTLSRLVLHDPGNGTMVGESPVATLATGIGDSTTMFAAVGLGEEPAPPPPPPPGPPFPNVGGDYVGWLVFELPVFLQTAAAYSGPPTALPPIGPFSGFKVTHLKDVVTVQSPFAFDFSGKLIQSPGSSGGNGHLQFQALPISLPVFDAVSGAPLAAKGKIVNVDVLGLPDVQALGGLLEGNIVDASGFAQVPLFAFRLVRK
jgi:hypothetical protein